MSVAQQTLNNLDVDVESAERDVQAATEKARKLRAKSGTCGLYVINLVLFAIMVVLAVFGFSTGLPKSCDDD